MAKYGPVPRKRSTFWRDLARTLRLEHDLSQRKLAQLAKLPRNTLRKIESGGAVPSVHTTGRILAVLGHELAAMRAD